jgi:cytochrome c553
MFRNINSFLLLTLSLIVPVGTLFIAGCSKSETPPEPSGERMGNSGGPGGRMGGPGGGRNTPVSVDAKAADIFTQKCQGCHGSKGEGKMGPSLMKASAEADDKLYATIHNGKGRMPGFGSQMTDTQVKELVAYVKKFGA